MKIENVGKVEKGFIEKTVSVEELINNAKTVGDYLMGELKKLPNIKEVRGFEGFDDFS